MPYDVRGGREFALTAATEGNSRGENLAGGIV